MSTTPSTDPTGPATPPTNEGRPSWRAPIVLAGLVALVVLVVLAAFLVFDDEDEGGGDATLVGLVDGELVHLDHDGEVVETFPLDADLAADDLFTFRPVGHHWVGTLEGAVVTIDARDGEVVRHPIDLDGQIEARTVRGTRSILAAGSPSGTSTFVVIDLESGERVEIDADGEDGMFLPLSSVGSLDGELVAVADMRLQAGEDPTHLVDLARDETFRLVGYTVGISDDRIVQRSAERVEDDDPRLYLQFFDRSGEPGSEVEIGLEDRPVLVTDGRVLLVSPDGVRLVEEGDDAPGPLQDRELGEIRYALAHLDGRRVLVSTDDGRTLLLDDDGEEIAELSVDRSQAPGDAAPDQRCVAFGFPGEEAVVVDLETGEALSDGSTRVAGYSLTAETCAVVLEDGRVTTLEGEAGSIELPEEGRVQAVAPDGSAAVVLGREGAELRTIDGEAHRISSDPGRFAYIHLG